MKKSRKAVVSVLCLIVAVLGECSPTGGGAIAGGGELEALSHELGR